MLFPQSAAKVKATSKRDFFPDERSRSLVSSTSDYISLVVHLHGALKADVQNEWSRVHWCWATASSPNCSLFYLSAVGAFDWELFSDECGIWKILFANVNIYPRPSLQQGTSICQHLSLRCSSSRRLILVRISANNQASSFGWFRVDFLVVAVGILSVCFRSNIMVYPRTFPILTLLCFQK